FAAKPKAIIIVWCEKSHTVANERRLICTNKRKENYKKDSSTKTHKCSSGVNDVSVQLHDQVPLLGADDLGQGVPSRHPEHPRAADDGPLEQLGEHRPAQDGEGAAVVLPRGEHEVDGRKQRRFLQGGLRE
ncbi:unnamed protein product, partial [Musa hybrid cultivar]